MTVRKGNLLRFDAESQWIFPGLGKRKISLSEQKKCKDTFQTQNSPSIPSVIAQLFALEGEGGSVAAKQLGPGAYWQELAWPRPPVGPPG